MSKLRYNYKIEIYKANKKGYYFFLFVYTLSFDGNVSK